MPESYQGQCNEVGCHKVGVFRTESGYWCANHLKVEDVPEGQMAEVIEWVAVLSDKFNIDAEGRISEADK